MTPAFGAHAVGAPWLAVALAVGGHAALGLSIWSAGPSDTHEWVQPSRPASSVRLVAPIRRPLPTPTAPTMAMPTVEPHAAWPKTAPTEAAAAEAVPEAEQVARSEARVSDDDVAEAPYYPRSELTVGPVPASEVLIPFPISSDDDGHRSGLLRLFIDEQGVVQDVLALDGESTLSPAMLVAARTAFLGTRFEPGQKQGQAVRSRIDVEVSFDAQRLPAVASAAP